jgi:putative transcriptional regulator
MIQTQIRELLKQRGRTLYWLAKQAGVGYPTVWKFSRNEIALLNLEVLDRLCAELGCQPGDLLVRVEPKRSRKASKHK